MKRNCLLQANQRVEEFKAQLKELKVKLKTAEKRAIFAEKTVKIFTKEMDKREGDNHIIYICFIITRYICVIYTLYSLYYYTRIIYAFLQVSTSLNLSNINCY